MQADFSVELGRDDAALELPWSSDGPSVRYYDLKANPELIAQIPEAAAYPPLAAFLGRINAPEFPLATAKCDAWFSNDIFPEEEIFRADRKFVSYIDLVFVDEDVRQSFEKHEAFAKELCRLLSHAPDLTATVELVIRRCYFHDSHCEMNPAEVAANSGNAVNSFDTSTAPHALNAPNASTNGFNLTVYISGFGNGDREPVRQWEIALVLLQHAMVQWSASRVLRY